jgi:hypothetical protein
MLLGHQVLHSLHNKLGAVIKQLREHADSFCAAALMNFHRLIDIGHGSKWLRVNYIKFKN